MQLDIHIHFHANEDTKIEEILRLLRGIQKENQIMSTELDALVLQVQANTDLEASAVAAIQGIAAQLEAAKDDPAKIASLTSSLKASADALGAAITANTTPPPAPPAPTP